MNELKLLSLFSGIGAFEKALNRIGIDYELVNYCEVDKYASKGYSIIHGCDESLNLGDITQVDEQSLPTDIDLITYGFPCQDLSSAGKGAGMINEDGTKTRSGLFFDALRIIETTQPRFAIAENVKALTFKKFEKEFAMVLDSLEQAGYSNYWKVLNAKEHGIPQNRERIFIVSIRKDVDKGFKFPSPIPLQLRLKDLLEEQVSEKFYLKEDSVKKLLNNTPAETIEMFLHGATKKDPNVQQVGNIADEGNFSNPHRGRVYSSDGVSPTIDTQPHYPKVLQVGNIVDTGNFSNPQRGRIYSADGLSPTLNTCSGGGLEPKIIEPICAYSQGRNPNKPSDRTKGTQRVQRLEPNKDGVSNTITTVLKDNYIVEPNVLRPQRTEYGKAIRKQYDAGEIKEPRRKNVIAMVPRQDGITNTITTLLKDNYLAEPPIQKYTYVDIEGDEQWERHQQIQFVFEN